MRPVDWKDFIEDRIPRQLAAARVGQSKTSHISWAQGGALVRNAEASSGAQSASRTSLLNGGDPRGRRVPLEERHGQQGSRLIPSWCGSQSQTKAVLKSSPLKEPGGWAGGEYCIRTDDRCSVIVIV